MINYTVEKFKTRRLALKSVSDVNKIFGYKPELFYDKVSKLYVMVKPEGLKKIK